VLCCARSYHVHSCHLSHLVRPLLVLTWFILFVFFRGLFVHVVLLLDVLFVLLVRSLTCNYSATLHAVRLTPPHWAYYIHCIPTLQPPPRRSHPPTSAFVLFVHFVLVVLYVLRRRSPRTCASSSLAMRRRQLVMTSYDLFTRLPVAPTAPSELKGVYDII